MKKLLLLFFVFINHPGFAQALPDSVVMTVNGKSIPLSEFFYIAQKNGEADLSSQQSVKEYVELFKNFKLKVADAEASGFADTRQFTDELRIYQSQLRYSYLSDAAGEESAAKVIYDRGTFLIEFSHIIIPLPAQTLSKDTLSAYNKAIKIYQRIVEDGEDIDGLGQKLQKNDEDNIGYQYVRCLYPMQLPKSLENVLYDMEAGMISTPVRSPMGYHIMKVHNRMPNPGYVQVSHILFALPEKANKKARSKLLSKAKGIYSRALKGEDFAELAKQYSDDSGSAKNGGIIPNVTPGSVTKEFEEAAFSLVSPGDLSEIVETPFGFHILKLINKDSRNSFEAEKENIISTMKKGEYNFELYKKFDDRMKNEYGYVFYPEAYKEFENLCNDYFPTSPEYYERTKDLDKPLFQLDGKNHLQKEFAYYIYKNPFSTKTYGGDFLQEVYNLLIRDIVTELERVSLESKYPEYTHLMQEYRDGILLFEISNQKIWSKPISEQASLEKKWLEEIKQKYPVVINWDALKKIKK